MTTTMIAGISHRHSRMEVNLTDVTHSLSGVVRLGHADGCIRRVFRYIWIAFVNGLSIVLFPPGPCGSVYIQENITTYNLTLATTNNMLLAVCLEYLPNYLRSSI